MKKSFDTNRVIHVIGLAATRATDEFSRISFTSIIRTFSSMMKTNGYHVIFYGVEGDEVDCSELVECFSADEFNTFFCCEKPHLFNSIESPRKVEGIHEFYRRCKEEIEKRIQQKEIVADTMGNTKYWIENIPDIIPVDFHVGHPNPNALYKVFPSMSWRAFYYGLQYADKKKIQDWKDPIPAYWTDAVIYHYVDPLKFSFEPNHQEYVVFMGRLNFDKGLYQAITACEQLDIPIKIAGAFASTESKDSFLDYITDKPLIEFLGGAVDSNTRNEIVRQAKCFLCPTLYHEPFGMVAIEAMALGTPVIATNWGGFSETVVHGRTGYLVSYFSELINALRNIDTISPHDCRQWIETNFTPDVVYPFFDRYIQRVLSIEHAEKNRWMTAELDFGEPVSQILQYPW
jgi:glycosyltransferase involved in cell wall biosynthesis